MYYFGDGVPKDYKKAAILFEKASELQNLAAMNALAVIYYNGLAGTKDINKAYELFQKSADLGFEDSITFLKKHPRQATSNNTNTSTTKTTSNNTNTATTKTTSNDTNTTTKATTTNKDANSSNLKDDDDDDEDDDDYEIYILPYIDGEFKKNEMGSYKIETEASTSYLYIVPFDGEGYYDWTQGTYRIEEEKYLVKRKKNSY